MPIEMILNELSLQPAPDIHSARERMSGLVSTILASTRLNVSKIVRAQDNVFDLELSLGYPLRRWLNDGDVDVEKQRYFRSLITKAPYWDGLPGLEDRLLVSDFRLDGHSASGLGVAYLLDYLALSLLSAPLWNAHRIALFYSSLKFRYSA